MTNTIVAAPTTGSIAIVKDAQPDDPQDFTFTPSVASINTFRLDDDSDPTLTNQRVIANLPAGSYTFTETQVAGWTLASVLCTPSGSTSSNLTAGSATITLDAGANVSCTFVNTKNASTTTGSITIVKDAQPDDPQDFVFTPGLGTMTSFTLDDDSDPTFSNQRVIANLMSGSYTFTETQVTGWALASITCTPSPGTSANLTTGSVTITLAAGANVTCTFVNKKL